MFISINVVFIESSWLAKMPRSLLLPLEASRSLIVRPGTVVLGRFQKVTELLIRKMHSSAWFVRLAKRMESLNLAAVKRRDRGCG